MAAAPTLPVLSTPRVRGRAFVAAGLLLAGALLLVAVFRAGSQPPPTVPRETPVQPAQPPLPAVREERSLPGRTQPAPGRQAKICPVLTHAVTEVLVRTGDRVKKGQALVRQQAGAEEANVRAKKAALAELDAGLAQLKADPKDAERDEAEALVRSSKTTLKAARQQLQSLEPLRRQGSIPEPRYQEARTAVARAEAEVRAAEARLDKVGRKVVDLELEQLQTRVAGARAMLAQAEADLADTTVASPIDGVVASLDVCLGLVPMPGMAVWGEVLDLDVLDVRTDVVPELADDLKLGQRAEVAWGEHDRHRVAGEVVNIAVAADPQTGRVPVLVRVPNRDGRLRCYLDVKVRLGEPPAPVEKK